MWAELLGGQLDPLASPATVRVHPQAWRASAAMLKSHGAHVFEWLSAVDRGDHVDVALHVRDTSEGVILITSVADGTLDSVREVWAGAAWHERETAEMFGISFAGHATSRLLLRDLPDVHAPLKRDFALSARIEKDWPAKDSLRRGQLPPGVNSEWLPS